MSKKLNQAFGKALREVRKAHRLSQLKISGRSGVDRTYISDLEHGRYTPSLDAILRLSKAIGISPIDLIRNTLERLSHK